MGHTVRDSVLARGQRGVGMIVDLIRTDSIGGEIIGILRMRRLARCLILERPWRNNEQEVSCIPAGEYKCRRVISPTFGETFEVCDVPGRTHILFHPGNTVNDSLGCLLPGYKLGRLNGRRAVLDSRRAHADFMAALNGVDEFTLRIQEVA